MERMVLVQDVYIECVQCIVELVISVRHRRNSVPLQTYFFRKLVA